MIRAAQHRDAQADTKAPDVDTTQTLIVINTSKDMHVAAQFLEYKAERGSDVVPAYLCVHTRASQGLGRVRHSVGASAPGYLPSPLRFSQHFTKDSCKLPKSSKTSQKLSFQSG